MTLLRASMLALATLLAAGAYSTVQAQNVAPPPLPAGSEQVVVQMGDDPHERGRSVRAHGNPKRSFKEKTRDDTLPPMANPAATNTPAPRNGQ